MLSRKWKAALWAVIALALVAGIYVGIQRMTIEAANKSVELTMGWDDFQTEAYKADYDTDTALKQGNGKINAFIFTEMTMEDLVNRNFASVSSGAILRSGIYSEEYRLTDKDGNLVPLEEISLDNKYYLFTDKAIVASLINAISVKSNVNAEVYEMETAAGSCLVIGYQDLGRELYNMGLVFDVAAMQRVNEAGYYVIPRFSTWADYSKGDMAALLSPLEGVSFGGMMFRDKVVPDTTTEKGDALTKDAANAIAAVGAPAVLVEFYTQKGLDQYFGEDYNVVRMHTINDAELATTVTPDVAFDRYSLAVSERNIRVLYVKTFPGKDFDGMMDYSESLTAELESNGFSLGKAEPIPNIPLHNVVLILIAFGVGAGAVLLGEKLRIPKIAAVLGILMIFGCTGLLLLDNYLLAARVVGLLSAMVFPSYALISYVGGKRSLAQTLLAFVKITAITLIGAVYIVGLFPIQSYMNSVTVFSGVKLGMLTPLFLLFLYCLFLRREDTILGRAKSLSRRTVNYGELVILAVLAVAFFVVLLRSGNEGMSVSGLEQTFRTALDHLLGVRPRTKEFLIGVPCLVIALYFGYKDYLLPLWLLGGIGQVSILNTFCHFHTPLYISVLRTLNGIWIGILLGLIAIGIAVWLIKKYKKKTEGKVL